MVLLLLLLLPLLMVFSFSFLHFCTCVCHSTNCTHQLSEEWCTKCTSERERVRAYRREYTILHTMLSHTLSFSVGSSWNGPAYRDSAMGLNCMVNLLVERVENCKCVFFPLANHFDEIRLLLGTWNRLKGADQYIHRFISLLFSLRLLYGVVTIF